MSKTPADSTAGASGVHLVDDAQEPIVSAPAQTLTECSFGGRYIINIESMHLDQCFAEFSDPFLARQWADRLAAAHGLSVIDRTGSR